MTPVGAGLQNLGMALLSGNGYQNAGRDFMNMAHAGLYEAQRRKADLEAAELETLARARSENSLNENAALLHGVPVPNVRALVDYSRGNLQMPPAMPGGVDSRRIAESIVAQRLGTMDKTANAGEIAKAMDTLRTTGTREDVIAGRLAPGPVTDAYFAVSGKPRFDNMGGIGSIDLTSGVNTLNLLGDAKVAAERALAGERGAQANLHRARERDITSGAAHPPVPVIRKDPEGNDMIGSDGKVHIEWVPRSQMAGRTAAPVPKDHRPPAEPKKRGLSATQSRTLAGALDSIEGEFGAKFDSETRRQLSSAATQLATDPESDYYQDPVGALDEAISKATGGKGISKDRKKLPGDWFIGTKVLTTGKPPAAGATTVQQPAAAVPAPAQRVKGQVYQTPRGPMKWTGTGWVPADA